MKLTGVQDLTYRVADPPLPTRHWFSMKVEELLIFAVLVAVSTLLSGCIVYGSS